MPDSGKVSSNDPEVKMAILVNAVEANEYIDENERVKKKSSNLYEL